MVMVLVLAGERAWVLHLRQLRLLMVHLLQLRSG
jgi:hypothetical protein